MKHAKVANTIVAFAEAIRSNQHMSSKIGDALAKLLHTKLDGDKMFERCKVLQRKKNDLADKVDSAIDEKDELANVVVDL